MSVAIIIGMGSLAVGCAVTEKVLQKLGKTDEAQMLNIMGISSLGATMVGCVLKVFSELRKLG